MPRPEPATNSSGARQIGNNPPGTQTSARPLAMMKPINSPEDHTAAKQRIGELMAADPAPGTPAADELEALARLAEAYEKQVYDLGGSSGPTRLPRRS